MSTPAGWYPDPSAPGRLRWWDGAAWTEHTHGGTGWQVPGPAAPGGAARQGSGAGDQHPWGQSPQARSPQAQDPWSRQPWGGPEGGHPGAAQGGDPLQHGGRVGATPDGQPLASLWARLAARLVDWLVIAALVAVAGYSYLQRLWVITESFVRESITAAEQGAPPPSALELAGDANVQQISAGLTVVAVAVSAVYVIPMLRYFGATPGKLLLRIRVRSWDRPGLPTWGQAVKRWFLADLMGNLGFLGSLFQLVDYLWPLWDRRRQALHDKWPRTVVVKR